MSERIRRYAVVALLVLILIAVFHIDTGSRAGAAFDGHG